MKKLILLMVLICTLVIYSTSTYTVGVEAENDTTKENSISWPKGPKVAAKSAIIMEASTGLILYSKNIHTPNFPASTTKLMTVLLALENTSMNEIVTFSHNAVFGIERNSSHIGINEGEELTVEECLYGIMLESANEVSSAIGEHIAGDIPSFSKMMNERAKELGCKNTNFVNANGLFQDEHKTSAYDLALISRELLKNDQFRKITSSRSYVVPTTNITDVTRPLNNHHAMLKNGPEKYDSCIGGKTGYTEKARYNLATFASRDNIELICIIMNENMFVDQYPDTRKLLDFGFENFKSYNVSGEFVENPIDFSYLFNKYTPLFNPDTPAFSLAPNGKVILPNSVQFSEVERVVEYNKTPDKEQNIIGTMKYTYGGKTVGSSDITYNMTKVPRLKKASVKVVEPNAVVENVRRNLKPFIIVGIVLIIVGVSLAYYFVVEKPRLKRRKAFYERRKRTRYSSDSDFLDFK